MSEELDRRIAIEVMGEPEPEEVWDNRYDCPDLKGWCWQKYMVYTDDRIFKPEPLPFSTTLEYALLAWEEFRQRFKARRGFGIELIISHDPEWEIPFVAATGYTAYPTGGGPTLLVAICNLLLVLASKEI